MELAPIIARIKASVPALKIVGGSADIPSAKEKLRGTPAAFVLPSKDVASPNALITGAISQQVRAQFGVLIAVRNVSDFAGVASHDALQPIRKSIKAALMGWQPQTDFEPITYVGGALLAFGDNDVLWWFDDFETSYFERVT